MSLKAKLEAVIYAAEEPVTLAQLAALFTADALEWKAEQAAVSAEMDADANQSSGAADHAHLLTREFDYLELENTAPVDSETNQRGTADPEVSESPAEWVTPPAAEASPAEPTAAEQESLQEPETAAELPAEDALPAAGTDTEPEGRRLARVRDREVRGVIRKLLDELIADYASDERGIEIREIAGGFRMATKPECHDAVRAFVKSLKPVLKLSLPALETLAVIAYKQPVTAPEVNEIRGVDSSGVFGSLLARKLIATAGRKQVIGRPILYKTTKEFLLRFGLKDVAELPSMEEFEKMAAIELDEPELAGQSEAAREIREDLSLELDAAQSGQDADASDEDTEATTPEAAPAAPPPTE